MKIKLNAILVERFWKRVKKGGADKCWPWLGSHFPAGYGQFHINRYPVQSNRVAWTITNGPIPKNLWVLHKCDNPSCSNPNHLFLGTHLDNMRDRHAKGRYPTRFSGHVRAKIIGAAYHLLIKQKINGVLSQTIAKRFNVHKTTVNKIYRNWRKSATIRQGGVQ